MGEELPPIKIDTALVLRASGAIGGRIAGGIALGVAVGVVAFVVEKAAGLLDAGAWVWALLPAYAIAGGVALLTIGTILAKRRAAVILLVESGLVANLTQRVINRADTGTDDLGTGSGMVRRFKSFAMMIIRQEIEIARTKGDPLEQVADRVKDAIGEWGETGVYVTLALLAVGLAIAPVALLL